MKIVLGKKRDENAQDKKVIEKTKKGFLSKFAKKKVISEQFDKRDACSKHFKMSDGSYQAVLYNEAVHFWDKDKKQFVDIDNRLTFKAKDNNKINKKITKEELSEVENYLDYLGLENGYIQDIETEEEKYVPDFEGE